MREIRKGSQDTGKHQNIDEEHKLIPAFGEFNTIDNIALSVPVPMFTAVKQALQE